MAITDGNRGVSYVWLDVQCRRNPAHILGTALLHLEPPSRAGQIEVGNGLVFDEHNVARGDCTAYDCAVQGRGSDQRVSFNRIDARMAELLAADRYNGKLQA